MLNKSYVIIRAVLIPTVLSIACSNLAVSGDVSAVNASAPLADLAFGQKFCNEVVDPLARGSNHWLACMREVERLAGINVNRSDLVLRTCRAIRDTLSDAGFLACQQNGARLVQAESFGESQKDLYTRTAGAIVACYEAVERIQPHYDETGRCSDDSELSAWTLSARSPTTAALSAFIPSGQPEATSGSYQGMVSFHNTRGELCQFALSFDYTGDDISAYTSDFNCGLRS